MAKIIHTYAIVIAVGVACPAWAKVTITDPAEILSNEFQFSLNDNVSFLVTGISDDITDIIDAVQLNVAVDNLEGFELKFEDPKKAGVNTFQIIANKDGDPTTNKILTFTLLNVDTDITVFNSSEVGDIFQVTFTFQQLIAPFAEFNITNDFVNGNKAQNFKVRMGFFKTSGIEDFNTENNRDIAQTDIPVRLDSQPPTTSLTGAADTTIAADDKAVRVTFNKSIPGDVAFIVLAFIKKADEGSINGGPPIGLEDIVDDDVVDDDAATRDTDVCFHVLEKTQGISEFVFDGKNKIDFSPCGNNVGFENVEYHVSLFVADRAGNLQFLKAATVTPIQLLGIFPEGKINCVNASIQNPVDANDTHHWPLMLLVFATIMGLVVWLRMHLSRFFFMVLVALTVNSQSFAKYIEFTENATIALAPEFGFIDVMLGFLPEPLVTDEQKVVFNYDTQFSPGINFITDGPTVFFVGVHWHPFRTSLADFGPFLRVGVSPDSGKRISTDKAVDDPDKNGLDVLLIPIQGGLSLTLHTMDYFLSLSIRAGVQSNIFNQTKGARSNFDFNNNFTGFAEANFKLNINWLEPESVADQMRLFGIYNTYLSFHVFYYKNISGNSYILDSDTTNANTQAGFFNRLAWLFGFTFEL